MTARPLFDHVVAEVSVTLGAPVLSEVAGGVVATWTAVTPEGIGYPARVRWMPARPDRVEAMLTAYDAYSHADERNVAVIDPPIVFASTNPHVDVVAPEQTLSRVVLAAVKHADQPTIDSKGSWPAVKP